MAKDEPEIDLIARSALYAPGYQIIRFMLTISAILLVGLGMFLLVKHSADPTADKLIIIRWAVPGLAVLAFLGGTFLPLLQSWSTFNACKKQRARLTDYLALAGIVILLMGSAVAVAIQTSALDVELVIRNGETP